MEKSVTRIIFSKLIGIFIFLLFVGVLNFLSKYLTFGAFISFTEFFNKNAILLISISVIFLFAELVSRTEFPSNIFGPVLNFLGAWMLLKFIFTFLEAIQSKFQFSFLENVFLLKAPIFFAILSLIFVLGYLPIIYNLIKERKGTSEKSNEPKIIENTIIVPKITKKTIKKEKFVEKDLKSKRKKNVQSK